MTRRFLPAAVFACLLMAGGAATATAATADFQCNCTFPDSQCVCDANRQSSFGPGTSCGSASVSIYFWDFGDGTSFFTTSAFVAHDYDGGWCDVPLPELAVFCTDGSSATRGHCFCNTVGINGCIRPGAGWTP